MRKWKKGLAVLLAASVAMQSGTVLPAFAKGGQSTEAEADNTSADKDAEKAAKAAEKEAAEAAARAESERVAAEEAARAESERIAAEEAARAESERAAAEEAARAESERIAAEEAARAESERIAAEEAARAESERIAAEEAARAESERKAAEEAAKESERKAAEEAAKESERKAAEEAAKESERKAAEAAAKESEKKAAEEAAKESERKAAEEAAKESEKKAAEEAAKESEKKAAEEAAKAESERKAAEEEARKESERYESERKAEEEAIKAESERQAALESEKAESERLESERKAAEKAEKEESERAESERLAAEELERKESEEAAKAESERLAAEESERLAKEAETETEEETETEKESETEQKALERPVNDGMKLTEMLLEMNLGTSLSYLVIASSYKGPELSDMDLLTGQDADDVLKGLKGISLSMANAVGSSEVTVLNLFADEKGDLDLSPLTEAFTEEEINVRDGFVVVNVIAASEDQKLEFSAFPVKDGKDEVTYRDPSEPGKVLYNFAVWENGEYKDYKGEVTLTDKEGLYGTFLAPEAKVKIEKSALWGSVFAKEVRADDQSSLTKIVPLKGRDLEAEMAAQAAALPGETGPTAQDTALSGETEPTALPQETNAEPEVISVETEPAENADAIVIPEATDVTVIPEETDTPEISEATDAAENPDNAAAADAADNTIILDEAASEPEQETETESESGTEEDVIEIIPVTEAVTEPATEAATEVVTEVETEISTEAPTEAETEPATEVVTEVETEAATEIATEVATEASTEAETEPVTEVVTEVETEAATEIATEVPTEAETEPATEVVTEVETEPATEVVTEIETEAATEVETEVVTEIATEAAVTEAETELATEAAAETEVATEAVTETVTESETELTTEASTEAGTEPATETAAETTTETETEPVTEQPTEVATEQSTETVTEQPTEAVTEAPAQEEETESEPSVEDITITADMIPTEEDIQILSGMELAGEAEEHLWFAAVEAELEVLLKDAASGDTLTEGTIGVYAARDILDEDDAVVYSQDDEITTHTWDAAEAYDLGSELQYSGAYYLALTDIPEGYAEPGRTYFRITSAGAVRVSDIADWDSETGLLTISLNSDTEPEEDETGVTTGILYLYVNDGDDNTDGSVFVVKDADGKVITDEGGYPKYYLTTKNGKAVLRLPAGAYILSQISAADGYLTTSKDPIQTSERPFEMVNGQKTPMYVVNDAVADDTNTLTITEETYFKTTRLTSEKKQSHYIALFSDPERTDRVSNVVKLTAAKNATASGEAKIEGLEDDIPYYLGETDEYGNLLDEEEITWIGTFLDEEEEVTKVIFLSEDAEEDETETEKDETLDPVDAQQDELELVLRRTYSSKYPDGDYSYTVKIPITMSFQKKNKDEAKVTGTFYVTLFEDEKHQTQEREPIEFVFSDASSKKETITKKMTTERLVLYAAQTDEEGTLITDGANDYNFAITYEDQISGDKDAKLTIRCQKDAGMTIINTLDAGKVQISFVDDSDQLLAGATYVLRNSERKLLSIGGTIIFTSEKQIRELAGLLPEGDYYLCQINAPDGYLPAQELSFTVEAGRTTEVKVTNKKAAGNASGTVHVLVYEGTSLLYSPNTATDGSDASTDKKYTRYVALFSDKDLTEKVSNVHTLAISKFEGVTEFKNLDNGETYYAAETDQYGKPIATTNALKFQYQPQASFKAGNNVSMQILEVHATRPDGFRYWGRLKFTKKIVDKDNQPVSNVQDTFSIGLYRTQDYSDSPSVIPVPINNQSEYSTEPYLILLPDAGSQTYYCAELDKEGKRISANGAAGFDYVPSFSEDTFTLEKAQEKEIILTNKQRTSDITLYLSKQVYRGKERIAMETGNRPFYATLFRDAAYTQPIQTIPLSLKKENNGSVTLKIGMSLGAQNEATLYIAETDSKGNVIYAKDEKTFGYNIRVINGKAEFNQNRTEVHTVLINSVYGSSSADDWNDIIGKEEEEIRQQGGGTGGSGYSGNGTHTGDSVSGNGDTQNATAVQTGDTTPILLFAVLFAAAAAVLIILLLMRRRKKK